MTRLGKIQRQIIEALRMGGYVLYETGVSSAVHADDCVLNSYARAWLVANDGKVLCKLTVGQVVTARTRGIIASDIELPERSCFATQKHSLRMGLGAFGAAYRE